MVETYIKSGISRIQIDNIHTIDNNRIRSKYKELLRNQITDEGLLDVMTLEENINKIKHRLDFNIEVTSTEGYKIGTLMHIGKKNLTEVTNEMKKELPKFLHINYLKGFKDYTTVTDQAGTVNKINITLTLRKR